MQGQKKKAIGKNFLLAFGTLHTTIAHCRGCGFAVLYGSDFSVTLPGSIYYPSWNYQILSMGCETMALNILQWTFILYLSVLDQRLQCLLSLSSVHHHSLPDYTLLVTASVCHTVLHILAGSQHIYSFSVLVLQTSHIWKSSILVLYSQLRTLHITWSLAWKEAHI